MKLPGLIHLSAWENGPSGMCIEEKLEEYHYTCIIFCISTSRFINIYHNVPNLLLYIGNVAFGILFGDTVETDNY